MTPLDLVSLSREYKSTSSPWKHTSMNASNSRICTVPAQKDCTKSFNVPSYIGLSPSSVGSRTWEPAVVFAHNIHVKLLDPDGQLSSQQTSSLTEKHTPTNESRQSHLDALWHNLTSVFHSMNSPDHSPFSDSVLPVASLPYWSVQQYVSLWKSPSALI